MTVSVSIREMAGRDVEPLAGVLELSIHQIARRWAETLFGYRETYVAELGGRAIGIVSLNEQVEHPGFGHLFALDVAAAVRSQGIGTQLIAMVEEQATRGRLEGVYLHVSLSNTGARRLYERLGYEVDGGPVESRWMSFDDAGTAYEKVETQLRLVKRF